MTILKPVFKKKQKSFYKRIGIALVPSASFTVVPNYTHPKIQNLKGKSVRKYAAIASAIAGGIALPRVVNELDHSDSFDSVSSDWSSAKESIVLNPSAGLRNTENHNFGCIKVQCSQSLIDFLEKHNFSDVFVQKIATFYAEVCVKELIRKQKVDIKSFNDQFMNEVTEDISVYLRSLKNTVVIPSSVPIYVKHTNSLCHYLQKTKVDENVLKRVVKNLADEEFYTLKTKDHEVLNRFSTEKIYDEIKNNIEKRLLDLTSKPCSTLPANESLQQTIKSENEFQESQKDDYELKDTGVFDTCEYSTNMFKSKFSVDRTLYNYLCNCDFLKNIPDSCQNLKNSDNSLKSVRNRIPKNGYNLSSELKNEVLYSTNPSESSSDTEKSDYNLGSELKSEVLDGTNPSESSNDTEISSTSAIRQEVTTNVKRSTVYVNLMEDNLVKPSTYPSNQSANLLMNFKDEVFPEILKDRSLQKNNNSKNILRKSDIHTQTNLKDFFKICKVVKSQNTGWKTVSKENKHLKTSKTASKKNDCTEIDLEKLTDIVVQKLPSSAIQKVLKNTKVRIDRKTSVNISVKEYEIVEINVPSPKKLWICEDKKVDITEVTKLVLHKLPGRIIAEIFKIEIDENNKKKSCD